MSSELWKGTIVKESLSDVTFLQKLRVLKIEKTTHWHLYSVELTKPEILELSKILKPSGWYAHFWNEAREVVAVFPEKTFTFQFDSKETWQPAIEYGLSLHIPREQIDFLVS